MSKRLDIPARYGFSDIRGFLDYLTAVSVIDDDFFVPEDFVPPELQWSVADVFRGLELGFELMAAKIGATANLVESRRLTSEARLLFDARRFEEGRDMLSDALKLIETPLL
jgi:hypothetical protein